MVFSEGGTLFTVRVDFFEDAVTFLEKEEAVEEITSGDRIYQACLDLEQATAREVFQHINPDTTKPVVPLSTLKNNATELKSAGLVEEVDKDGNAPIYAPVECPGGTREDRPTGRPTTYTDDDVTISRQGSDGEGEKIPPSALTSIVRGVEKPKGGEVPMPPCYALESYDGYRLKTILREGTLPHWPSRRTRGVVSASTIKHMVNSSRPTVREETLSALASALSVPVEDLRGDEE